jgi:hypothetical protein
VSADADSARALWTEVEPLLDSDARLAQRVAGELRRSLGAAKRTAKHPPNRRAAPVLDPFDVYRQGAHTLRPALEPLGVEQLKDVVSHYSMDSRRLALKWKTPGRLIDLICNVVEQRAAKGDAFRS